MTPLHEPDPSGSPLAFFAAELRRVREEAGLTQEQLGALINYSSAQVSAVENCKRNPKKDFADSCDKALKTDGTFSRLWPLVRRAVHRGPARSYFELEREATCIRNFEPINVPGLLQTESYIRTVMEAGSPGDSDERIEAKIAERLERQKLLLDKESPALVIVLDEAVLNRPVGGADTMRGQLQHLLRAANDRRMTLQVVPSTVGAYPGTNGPIALLSLPGTSEIGYLDNAMGGQIVNAPEDVAKLAYRFDVLRAEALPERASIELIGKVLEKWT
ncbi:helix-turn-helix domain-containing protein [Sphaerisporangium perillae]|uniref:helix-turn-helix domain-containing protein n=1 Tax=Sphaerisporangium perillae TaxID=2935860 RepID=UPI00200E6C00|nr:helix-turn-helix transcriptional regulator [Sphaerisporangium perillae]